MKTEADNYVATHEPKLERVLVVISPDLVKPGAPKQSKLITRAIALANATGCELELFHICHDSSLTPAFSSDKNELHRAQEECVNRDATMMAELVARLNAEGVTIHYDTRWHSPRADAVLRKINEAQPDLAMKQ